MRTVISARKHDKIVAGHRSFEKGLLFENSVRDYFEKQGYRIMSRRRFPFGEVDLVAEKTGWRGHKLLIECKHKEKISLKDFVHFVHKFTRSNADAGVFAYRGDLDPDIKRNYSMLNDHLRRAIHIERH